MSSLPTATHRLLRHTFSLYVQPFSHIVTSELNGENASCEGPHFPYTNSETEAETLQVFTDLIEGDGTASTFLAEF